MDWRRLRGLTCRAGPCALAGRRRRLVLFRQRAAPGVAASCCLLLCCLLLLPRFRMRQRLRLVCIITAAWCCSWRRLVDALVGSLKQCCCERHCQRLYVPEQQMHTFVACQKCHVRNSSSPPTAFHDNKLDSIEDGIQAALQHTFCLAQSLARRACQQLHMVQGAACKQMTLWGCCEPAKIDRPADPDCHRLQRHEHTATGCTASYYIHSRQKLMSSGACAAPRSVRLCAVQRGWRQQWRAPGCHQQTLRPDCGPAPVAATSPPKRAPASSWTGYSNGMYGTQSKSCASPASGCVGTNHRAVRCRLEGD